MDIAVHPPLRLDQVPSCYGPFLLPVAAELRLRGEDPFALMAAVGIDPAKMADPEWRIPRPVWQAFMASCVTTTGDEAFGLHAARQLRPQMLRSLGLAWLASDTVFDGLRRMVRFSKLMTTAAQIELIEQSELVNVIARATDPTDLGVPAVTDYLMGIVVRMSRLTLGDYLAPVQVSMARPQPRDTAPWTYYFAAPVTFDHGFNAISWARSDILEPLATGDPALARVNDEHTEAVLDAFLSHSLSRRVVEQIIQQLPDGAPSQASVASALNMSSRTLQRRLKDEGITFVELRRETRLRLAYRHLANPGRSIVEIAYLLGFSEPSAFSRAFKSATGRSPAEYRADNVLL